jgi:uncharacterized protein (DUF1786 family)
MRILTVDVGTGTQDIFLYDSALDLENGYKLVVPSPTMLVHRRLKEATRRGEPVLLTGVIMGGGPSQWAAADHVRAGLPLYATPEAARSFNDDLDYVQREMGLRLVSDDEARRLDGGVTHLELKDFDLAAIAAAFAQFGVRLDVGAIGVAVFDHGNSPPDYSDRQFRFDYLDERIRAHNRLSAFAFPAAEVPPSMTRLQAVAASYSGDAPLVVMDTAPAAVLGATLDPRVGQRQRVVVVNVGNFHTLAFRLGAGGIEGVFEHHTGEIDSVKLDNLLASLADSTLRHADVFDDMGHGALIYQTEPLPLDAGDYGVAVTGPRRGLMRLSRHRPYFAVPFGDMMIAGCFGLLAAMADALPNLGEAIRASLRGQVSGTAPWDTA